MSENNSSSDWLYLLLTLLTAAFSFIRSLSQKNKKNKTTLSFPKNNIEENPQYDHTKKRSVSGESPKSEHETDIKEHILEISHYEKEITDMEDVDFDLKKAIIYHEILNRKYE